MQLHARMTHLYEWIFTQIPFHIYCLGKIVNKHRIVCGRIPGSMCNHTFDVTDVGGFIGTDVITVIKNLKIVIWKTKGMSR